MTLENPPNKLDNWYEWATKLNHQWRRMQQVIETALTTSQRGSWMAPAKMMNKIGGTITGGDGPSKVGTRDFLRKRLSRKPAGRHLNLGALTEAQMEDAALEAGVPLGDLLPPGLHLAYAAKSYDMAGLLCIH